jgi:hypothetical protein
MKNIRVMAVASTMAVALAGAVLLASNATFVITPASPVFDANNVQGVLLDGAPGYSSGSFKSNGVGKTDMYFTPESLFGGRSVTLGDIAGISYWTKTGAIHSVDPRDWFLAIYTKPYAGDVSSASWYGDRIGTEPYFSAQTGSGWAAGFEGQVDGLRIELTDGSVANVNFEAVLEATDPSACKKNGWKTLFRADGSTFKNQGACVSYVNKSK